MRLVLSSTSSLTRESPVLQKYPSLAIARKRILSCLATLVNQARRASSPAIDEEERGAEKKLMVKMSKNVWDGVQSFLVLADKYDIWLSQEEIMQQGEQKSTRSAAEGVDAASRRSPTKSIPTTTGSNNSLSTLSARNRRSFVVHSTAELAEIITLIHYQLLSTISSFIAHIHAHTRSSRSSSYAQLIDMTRDTIAKVREVLVVVEAVIKSPSLVHASTRTVEIKSLKGHREVLHAATTALVTAAKIATSSDRVEVVEEEEEQSTLLRSASAVLKAAGDCVAVVKKCIAKRDSGLGLFELSLPNLDRPVSSLSSFPDYHSNPSSPTSITTRPNPLEPKSPTRSSSSSPKKVRSPVASISGGTTEISAAVFAMMEIEDTDDVAHELPPIISPRHSPSLSHRASPSEEYRFDPLASSSSVVGLSKSTSLNGFPSNQQVFPSSALNSSFGSGRPIMHSRTSSRASSSRGEKRIASVPMSRNESSRTSESATSSRSAVSTVSTNETSPRSSASLNADIACPSDEQPPLPSRRPSDSYSPSLAFSAFRSPDAISATRPAGATVWYLERDYSAKEVSFNCDGHLTGATLPALIERMTLHDTTIDPTFANTFFLCFRNFTTPTQLSEALYQRYALAPSPEMSSEEITEWTTIKATPIRLRIFNLFKTWLESHWQPETDAVITPSLLEFCQHQLSITMASAATRLVDLVQKRMDNNSLLRPRLGESRTKSSEQMKAGKIVGFGDPYSSTSSLLLSGPTAPPSIISKNLLQQIRSSPTAFVNVTEIDPLELARQLTIMESRLFCAIKSDELLSEEKSLAANVRAMSSLSTRLAGWIVALILNERDPKKRTSLVKYFIKLSDVRFRSSSNRLFCLFLSLQRCLTLNNYNTLMAVLSALNSSTIARLKRTWDGVSGKYRLMFQQLRKSTEHTRNYAEYRARIREALPPCLPFLGLFLTDITFCYEGNQAERASPLDPNLKLINFDRYQVSRRSRLHCTPTDRLCDAENGSDRQRRSAIPNSVQSHRSPRDSVFPRRSAARTDRRRRQHSRRALPPFAEAGAARRIRRLACDDESAAYSEARALSLGLVSLSTCRAIYSCCLDQIAKFPCPKNRIAAFLLRLCARSRSDSCCYSPSPCCIVATAWPPNPRRRSCFSTTLPRIRIKWFVWTSRRASPSRCTISWALRWSAQTE